MWLTRPSVAPESGAGESPALLICYGNPLRGDDAVGWRVAERLQQRVTDSAVQILTVHQLTPELMEPISRARKTIFVDACAGGEPGAIRQRPIEAARPGAPFTHHATPAGLIQGALDLYGHAPEALMFTVSGECFEFGAALSPAVHDAVERLAQILIATSLF